MPDDPDFAGRIQPEAEADFEAIAVRLCTYAAFGLFAYVVIEHALGLDPQPPEPPPSSIRIDFSYPPEFQP